MTKLEKFFFNGKSLSGIYRTTSEIVEGIKCDTYSFTDDPTRDLAIVRVRAGCKTPLQKVVGGTETLEGYIHGKGKLTIHENGHTESIRYESEKDSKQPITIVVGTTMQWTAEEDSDIEFYEICTPPYEEGRFKNTTLGDI